MNLGPGCGVTDGMDVYLLPRRDGSFFLYAGVSAKTWSEPSRDTPVAQKLLAYARGAYAWATRSRREKELLMKSLGELQHEPVRILHPSSMTEERARGIYRDLLEDAIQKHRKWMIVNTAALPATVPLSLVPGPNVILGYLAWRSVTHYRTKQSAERAATLAIDFVPEPVLAELEDIVRNQTLFRRRWRIRRLGSKLGLGHLDEAYA